MPADFVLVYDELRALAGSYFRGRMAGQTLQPTALVNEAYLKLAGAAGTPTDRAHFFAVAATAMRQILIDHARRKGADKRGGDRQRVTLTGDRSLLGDDDDVIDVIALGDLLDELALKNPMQAKIVELRLFGGLTVPEMAATLDASVRSVERHLRFARAWLKQHWS